ncbi:ABC transporter substrate-binding protein [Thermodesulfobacteriota bacterium]
MLLSFLFVLLQTSKLNAQSLFEEAKKEGKITLYSGLTMPDTQFVGDAFTKKYPFIKFDFIRASSAKLLQKIMLEKQGGKRIADVGHTIGNLINPYKKEGLIQKYVSPETKDWPEGFKDPVGYWTTYITDYNTWAYNTQMVSEKEAPKNYEDLLDPKWKGKIGLANTEHEWYQGMMDLMGREKGLQFMKRLASQDLMINSGKTLTAQLCASGEFALAKGALHRYLQLKKKGAPVQWTSFPTPILAGLRVFVLYADAPHPNAGKLFIDFMLSREGQEVMNKLGRHPVRKDIKVDPVLEKVRRNVFPIKPRSAEETTAYMKEFNKILLNR